MSRQSWSQVPLDLKRQGMESGEVSHGTECWKKNDDTPWRRIASRFAAAAFTSAAFDRSLKQKVSFQHGDSARGELHRLHCGSYVANRSLLVAETGGDFGSATSERRFSLQRFQILSFCSAVPLRWPLKCVAANELHPRAAKQKTSSERLSSCDRLGERQ